MIKALITSMRPKQWTKNLILFAGILFAQKLSDLSMLAHTCAAFVLFCLISGTIYIFNDVMDINEDKLHPRKKNRPIAAGKISVGTATSAAVIIYLVCVTLSFLLNIYFGFCVLIYFLMMFMYSRFLKHVVILDIMIIAMGFVLRAYAGVVVNKTIFVSPWLLACTLFLALFLGICKRRNEMLTLSKTANHHRKVLSEYSMEFLNQMMAIVTSTTVVAYALYTISEETIRKFNTKAMILTFPFVLYGILRYLYLVYIRSEGGEPEMLLLKDKPLILDIIFWIVMVVLVIYSPIRFDEFLHIGGF